MKIRKLSKLNQQLNCLVSTPLTIFLSASILFCTVTISVALFGIFKISFLVYMSCIAICLIFVVYLCNNIETSMKKIYEALCTNQWRLSSFNRKQFLIQKQRFPGTIPYQIMMYREHFRLKLFDLINIDSSFILEYFLLILTNAFIIVQTNK